MAAQTTTYPDLAEVEDIAAVARARYERALRAHEELEDEADAVIDHYVLRLARTKFDVDACKFDYEARLTDAQKARQ